MKQRKILERKLTKRKDFKKICIGILGTHHGAGTSYTGILLANYLALVQERKTAYLAYMDPMEMDFLKEFYEFPDEDKDSFTYDLITFYTRRPIGEEIKRLHLEYDSVIIDFGTNLSEYCVEFQQCDYKMVITGLAEWNQRKLVHFINHWDSILKLEDWSFLIPMADSPTIHRFRRTWDYSFYSIPYESSSMSVSKKTKELFHKILS